jgi:CubicO group peptidase (beta-lactamase class C family)
MKNLSLVPSATLLFCAFLAAGSARAIAVETPPQAPLKLDAAKLSAVIDPLMSGWVNTQKGPGAVVTVATRDGLVFAKGYGHADVAAGTPFTADTTLVRPGSVSKLFTGIAVMQLVDAGKLDLDKDVNAYLDFSIPTPGGGVPVTLRRLLRHRAGFEEHVKGLFSRDPEPEPLGRWLARSLPPRLFPRGDIPAYSNYGVALAGYIVERVSGEPYAAYMERHILEPLQMTRSTFRQPLPSALAPMMAKGYRIGGKPLGVFETIAGAPAGALSATGTDMARFMRALLNGGVLDGVRILSKERLDEMTAPRDATAAGYLGLAFFGRKLKGYDTIGHDGETMAFFSALTLFPAQDFGVFVSFDGMPNPRTAPDPTSAVVDHFLPNSVLPKPDDAPTPDIAARADKPNIAGVYRPSRWAESTLVRLHELIDQVQIGLDKDGQASLSSAIWPFGKGTALKRVDQNLYLGPKNLRLVFDNTSGAQLVTPAVIFQRISWYEGAGFIGAALAASTLILFFTLLAWPLAALSRRWRTTPRSESAADRRRHPTARLVAVGAALAVSMLIPFVALLALSAAVLWLCCRGTPWSESAVDRRLYATARLVALVDVAVIVATLTLFALSIGDLTYLTDALDPWLVILYVLAWLGVAGAIPAVWIAVRLWWQGIGGWQTRAHHSLVAASTAFLAWFFVAFHIAGTALNY